MPKLTEEETEQQIVQAYKDDVPIEEILKEHDVPLSRFYHILGKHNIDMKGQTGRTRKKEWRKIHRDRTGKRTLNRVAFLLTTDLLDETKLNPKELDRERYKLTVPRPREILLTFKKADKVEKK